jgi:hypothetical protein
MTTRIDTSSTDPLKGDEPERNFLAEAHAILDGTSLLLPERAHLQALLQARWTP